MNQQILHDCIYLALAGKMSFPETVTRMKEAGVERYYADLVTLTKIHYPASGEAIAEPIPLQNPPSLGAEFSIEGVQLAITDIQQGRIQYDEFLRRVMAAGVTDYTVYIVSEKTIYHGRNGDFHIEQFRRKQ